MFRGVLLLCVIVFAAVCFVVFSFGGLWFLCLVDGVLVTLVLVASVYGLLEDCCVYIKLSIVFVTSVHRY
jgi:hypothetical protein